MSEAQQRQMESLLAENMGDFKKSFQQALEAAGKVTDSVTGAEVTAEDADRAEERRVAAFCSSTGAGISASASASGDHTHSKLSGDVTAVLHGLPCSAHDALGAFAALAEIGEQEDVERRQGWTDAARDKASGLM